MSRLSKAAANSASTPERSDLASASLLDFGGKADYLSRTEKTVQRRRFLPLAAVALAGCLGARDETEPRNPPTTPEPGGDPPTTSEPSEATTDSRGLKILDAGPREGENGELIFAITVENTSDSPQSDTLVGVATVDAEGENTEYNASRAVELEGNSEGEFDLVFDVTYEEWTGNGGLTYGWEGEL